MNLKLNLAYKHQQLLWNLHIYSNYYDHLCIHVFSYKPTHCVENERQLLLTPKSLTPEL